MLTTAPPPARTMGGTKAWQTSMVPTRLFSVSTLMSSNGHIERVVGIGLAAGRADVAAGAIHQDMDLAQRRVDVRLHLRNRARVADVAGDRGHLAAVQGDPLRDFPEIG